MTSQMLRIDLSNRSYQVEEIPDKIINQYIGGRGLGAYLLYSSVPSRIDPLGEENHLILESPYIYCWPVQRYKFVLFFQDSY